MSCLLLCYSQELLETLPEYKETFESFTAHAYGTMLAITLVMNGLVPGVTSALSRD